MICQRPRTGSECRQDNSAKMTEEVRKLKLEILSRTRKDLELWLRLKDKETEAWGEGPDSLKPAPCIPKAQTSKQLGELTLNDSQ